MSAAFLSDILVVTIIYHKFETIGKEKKIEQHSSLLGLSSYEIKTNLIFVKEFSHTIQVIIFWED